MKPKFSAWSESDYEDDDNQPVRTRIQRKGIGIIEMDYYDDEMVMWCSHCASYGFHVALGPKILMPGQKREPDYENWLQCPDCFEVVAAYVIEHDAMIIRDDIPTVETPFENTTEIMGLPKRTSKQGIKVRKRRNRPTHKDKEIQREIDQHGIDNVNVIYDSNP
jgi:hypothetical protein